MGEKKIKLIWDFRGPNAREVARHHQKHLDEFIASDDGLDVRITGHSDLSSLHSLAYMVVEENQVSRIRDILRPQRGEIYDDES